MNKQGPCLEKNCSWCCNPVKIGFNKRTGLSDFKIPKDENGKDIWEETDNILAPENHPETIIVKEFKCVNHDKENNRCRDYENRPDICRNTSCISPESKESIEEQHKKMTSEKFLKMR